MRCSSLHGALRGKLPDAEAKKAARNPICNVSRSFSEKEIAIGTATPKYRCVSNLADVFSMNGG